MDASSDLDAKRLMRLAYRKKRLFLATAALVSAAVVLVGYLLPKTYEARSVIFIERNVLNELIKTVTVTSSFEEKVKALAVVLKSRNLVLKVMNDLDLDLNRKTPDEVESMVRGFQEGTQIKIEVNRATQRDTDLFMVSYRDSDPKLASAFVNALVRRYIEDNLSSKREEAYGASRFIVDQISTFKTKLEKIELAIAKQRRERNVSEKAVTLSERLQELQAKRDALLVQYTENHPEVSRLKSEIESLRSLMAQSLNAPGPDRVLVDLERERDTTKKIYEDLLSTLRRSEVSTQLEVQDKAGAFRILDPAVPPTRPLSPNMVRIALLAIAAGVGAGLALLILSDRFDPTVKSADTLKKLGMPVLAVISTMRSDRETAAAQRRDGIVYVLAGIYLAVLLTVAGLEAMGYAYIDEFVQSTRAGITTTVKKVSTRK